MNAHRRRGSSLIFVVMVLAAVAMLSLSLVSVMNSSQRELQGSRENLSALYVSEAGLSAALRDLAEGGFGDLGSQNEPIEYGSSSFYVEVGNLGDERLQLRSVGRDDRSEVGVELVVRRVPDGFFQWAAFGDESLHLDSNSRTDSYDSDAGTYASQASGAGNDYHANENGDVGSNENVTMDSNIAVWGDAVPGPSGTVSGSQLANITGSTTPAPAATELPPINVPVIPLLGPGGFNTTTLSSGEYHYSTFQVHNNQTLTIVGPASIVCDNFILKSDSQIRVDATNGPVRFYVMNDFIMNSNSRVYSLTYKPLDVAFSLLSDNIIDPDVSVDLDDVEFESNSKIFGTLYAPNAEVVIDSNFELFGSLVSRRVNLDSNCRLHYDEALAGADMDGVYGFQSLCWRLVSVP